MNEIEKRNILKYYLKNFAVYFDDKEENMFKQLDLKIENQIIKSDNFKTLSKAICYILLNAGDRVNYQFVLSNGIIDKMLNADNPDINEECTYDDLLSAQLLIIHHSFAYKKNKILWETLDNIIQARILKNKITILITDGDLSDDNGSIRSQIKTINLFAHPNSCIKSMQKSQNGMSYR